jgi:hypothetical protein
MIAKFETGSLGSSVNKASGTSSNGANVVIVLALVTLGGYLVWKYIIKPKQEIKKQEEQK